MIMNQVPTSEYIALKQPESQDLQQSMRNHDIFTLLYDAQNLP